MKKLKLLILFLIFISNSLFAQNKEINLKIDTAGRFSHWSISIDGGEIVPFSTFGNLYKNSVSAGIQITYHTSHRLAIFFNPQYNFLNTKDINYAGTAGYIELVAGAKMYFGKFPQIFFAEAGLGDYIYAYSNGNYINGSSENIFNYFGIKAGAGANIPVGRKISIFFKSDFHFIFSSSYKTGYLGLYAGVNYLL